METIKFEVTFRKKLNGTHYTTEFVGTLEELKVFAENHEDFMVNYEEVEERDILEYLTIECPKCRKTIQLKTFTDNNEYGCGWNYECKCGHKGFVWEGAFDC